MQVTLPSLTFERSLVLYRPARTVQILWLGRGHTEGDVVVFVPQDRVLLTGDLIHGWMPWMGDSHPYEWIDTLAAAERLDFDTVLSGHGDVLRGKDVFTLWRGYLRDLMDEAAKAYGDGATLAEARTRVAAALRPKYSAPSAPRATTAACPATSTAPTGWSAGRWSRRRQRAAGASSGPRSPRPACRGHGFHQVSLLGVRLGDPRVPRR